MITEGIVVTKNLKETTLINNCSQPKILEIRKNNVIKFKNCNDLIGNLQLENSIQTYHDKLLPIAERNITITTINKQFHIEDLHAENINNIRKIDEMTHKAHVKWFSGIATDVVIIAILIAVFTYLFRRHKPDKTGIKIDLTNNCQESTLEEGGVKSKETETPFA